MQTALASASSTYCFYYCLQKSCVVFTCAPLCMYCTLSRSSQHAKCFLIVSAPQLPFPLQFVACRDISSSLLISVMLVLCCYAASYCLFVVFNVVLLVDAAVTLLTLKSQPHYLRCCTLHLVIHSWSYSCSL